jgi:hypothetical protein
MLGRLENERDWIAAYRKYYEARPGTGSWSETSM